MKEVLGRFKVTIVQSLLHPAQLYMAGALREVCVVEKTVLVDLYQSYVQAELRIKKLLERIQEAEARTYDLEEEVRRGE